MLALLPLELGLRLFGYGQPIPLFIPTPDSANYLLPHPNLMERYFPAGGAPPVTLEASFFRRDKPEDGLRLFVQGASTAAGHPYGLGASLAGMLDQRLRRTFPGRYVEVVNTALAAVNSHTLLDFADEIIGAEPDAVLIYAGHNEYLGVLGVGSTYLPFGSATLSRLFLHLRTLRIVHQLLSGLLPAPPPRGEARTLMAQIAANRHIPYGSPEFHQGLRQLRGNLDQLLAKYRRAGVPALICTVASNMRQQRPFNSSPLSEQMQRLLTAAQGNAAALREAQALAARTDNALFQFEVGQLLLEAGDGKTAKGFLLRALQQDLLRFRAPPEANAVIRAAAAKNGAILVDCLGDLERRSPAGIVGREFMLEHLHPNVEGYFALADAFYQAMRAAALFDDWGQAVPTEAAWRDRPLLEAEEYAGFAGALKLMSDYPFTKTPQKLRLPPPQNPQQRLGLRYFLKEIDWLTMVRGAEAQYRRGGQTELADKALRLRADALPFSAELNQRAAWSARRGQRPLEAAHFLRRCRLEAKSPRAAGACRPAPDKL